ncbi:hypothetical protein [Streptomyces sp. BH055]|uniref:hypothetical protein n=1 Tax=unclassified Streptomyces TaxID=2593676 RepID=UPI003BB7E3EF
MTAPTTPKARKAPTAPQRRALLAALAHPKGRVPGHFTARVLGALETARWVTEVTTEGHAAAGARWAGYIGHTFWVINSRGRRALLTDAGHTALYGADDNGRLPGGTTWSTARALHRDGLVEYRDANKTVQPNDGDTGASKPLYAPYVTELGRRLTSGFPQARRTA